MPANPPSPHRAVASAPVSRVALAGGWLVGVTARLSAGTGTRIGNGACAWLHAVCTSAFVAWLCLFGGLAAAQGTEVAVAECSVPNGGLPLAGTLATWLDPTGQATSFDVREKLAKNAFNSNKSDDVSYGFVSGAI